MIRYMATAGVLSGLIFIVVFLFLRAEGDVAAWIPAGLVAGFVMLLAVASREIVMRRAWARYAREIDTANGSLVSARHRVARSGNWDASIAPLRTLQKRIAELDSANTTPEVHQQVYRLCEQYLASAEEIIRVPGGSPDLRLNLRTEVARLRALHKKHLLAWTRGEVTRLTQEAQRQVRASDKIETARHALEVLDEAMKTYPDEHELGQSSIVVRNFIASVTVKEWVEVAERSAFRGEYERAIARYRDALFHLARADMTEKAREKAANRIQREIELLRARLATAEALEGDNSEADQGLIDENTGEIQD